MCLIVSYLRIMNTCTFNTLQESSFLCTHSAFVHCDDFLIFCPSTFIYIQLSPMGEEVMIPCTNLSKSKHGSWLLEKGYKQKISLYDACVTLLSNVLLQSTRQLAFFERKFIGRCPSLEMVIQ